MSAVRRFPRFRSREVVRVLQSVTDDKSDARGMEGVVSGFAPDEGGKAWSIGVWLPEFGEVWAFEEDELEGVGFVQPDEHDENSRRPLDPSTHEESFGGELTVRLLTKIQEAEAPRVADAAEAALRRLLLASRFDWKGEEHWHPPYRYDLEIEVWTEGDSREAFEALVTSRPSGWTSQVDDGWGCHFWWSREADETGTPFLVPEADDVAIHLTPWSDPSSRPVKRGRTHDPGLPGFTPPPPAAGYE
jgi:hypothetical protein